MQKQDKDRRALRQEYRSLYTDAKENSALLAAAGPRAAGKLERCLDRVNALHGAGALPFFLPPCLRPAGPPARPAAQDTGRGAWRRSEGACSDSSAAAASCLRRRRRRLSTS